MDMSSVKEEYEGYDITAASKEEETIVITKETTAMSVDVESPGCSPDNTMSFFSQDVPSSLKPTLSYIALIAKVILSSPSKKLSLGSIYRAMEQRFSHLRSRGPGWKNSVRHNLSVNDCFVKVNRCEDGRGHYWGIHETHLTEFQRGNFRRYRNTRGKREKERNDSVARCLAWMETRFSESGSEPLPWMKPHCPLQDLRRNVSCLNWIQPSNQPWNINLAPLHPPNWMACYCIPERPLFSNGKATAGKVYNCQHCWDTNVPTPNDVTDSHDGMLITAPDQVLRFPCCWYMCPVITELMSPLVYKIKF